jgi:hypothetical protein
MYTYKERSEMFSQTTKNSHGTGKPAKLDFISGWCGYIVELY